MNNTEQQTGLRSIHDLLADSRQSYMDVCNRVDDRRTKDLLRNLSWGRIALESELMAEIRRLGPEATVHKDATDDEMQRPWINVRDALTAADDAHVLAGCERGEDYLLARYDAVLKGEELELGTRSLLNRQRAQLLTNVNTVKSRSKLVLAEGR